MDLLFVSFLYTLICLPVSNICLILSATISLPHPNAACVAVLHWISRNRPRLLANLKGLHSISPLLKPAGTFYELTFLLEAKIKKNNSRVRSNINE